MDPERADQQPRETRARQTLRMETRGLIVIAAVIFVIYLVRYFHLLHRSAP